MEFLTATYTTPDGRTFDVEVISEFRGMSEVNGIDCYPFLNRQSHSIVKTESLTNRRVEVIDDLPVCDDELTDEVIFDRSEYRQKADTYALGMGA